jgi:cation diffusion facilitator CzcD-associated flavoprotein CzcO
MTAPNGEAGKDPVGDQRLDVVVVGGSQAGLAMGWHLAQQGLRFVVLEAGPEVGHVWRSRWDSLKLFTPAQYDALPGMAFQGRLSDHSQHHPATGEVSRQSIMPAGLNHKLRHSDSAQDC